MTSMNLPRRLLAAAGLAGVLAIGGSALPAATVPAPPSHAPVLVAAEGESDNIGRLGLAELTGMLGLFGYRKYRSNRATPPEYGPNQR